MDLEPSYVSFLAEFLIFFVFPFFAGTKPDTAKAGDAAVLCAFGASVSRRRPGLELVGRVILQI